MAKTIVKYEITDYSTFNEEELADAIDAYSVKIEKLYKTVPNYKSFKLYFGIIMNVYNIIREMENRGLDSKELDFRLSMEKMMKDLNINDNDAE